MSDLVAEKGEWHVGGRHDKGCAEMGGSAIKEDVHDDTVEWVVLGQGKKGAR